MMVRSPIRNLSLLLFLIFGCKERDKDKNIITSVKPFELVKLADLENKAISMHQFKGKTIFLNFWATWCKPCIAEMPSIQEAQDILQDQDVVFLLASGESAEEINSFRNANSYKFNFMRVENSEDLNIQALPTTFIFDTKGDLVFSETGTRKWDDSSNISLIIKIATKND